MDRSQLLSRLASTIEENQFGTRPLRVAIDGRDTAGKTVLATELETALTKRDVSVIRAGIDGYHRPREQRYRRGPDSPEGYYRDSFDLEALRSSLLEPLGPDGDRQYVTRVFDYRTDQPVTEEPKTAPQDAVLLFDGVFLLQDALRDCWDRSIYVHVPEAVVLKRAVQRDAEYMGGEQATRERYLERYLPGQDLYHQEAAPKEKADIVIDNTDFEDPVLTVEG